MDLLFLMNQATFALGNEVATRLAGVGLTPRQYCVLSKALEEDLTQIRLAEASMLDKTTMVVTLDELLAGDRHRQCELLADIADVEMRLPLGVLGVAQAARRIQGHLVMDA